MSAPRSFEDVAQFIRANEVGRRAYIETPFGPRLICYADLTASGRYLHFVEAWIRRVRPFYANTHTAVSSTGRILTELREHARSVVHRSVNAGPDDHVVFCGSGATSSVNKLVGLLGLRIPEPLERLYALSSHIPVRERPVVFIGPYEHHSNELPWVESIADVVEVPLADDGTLDVAALERLLAEYGDRALKIGSFSAASNVTGILSDVPRIARVLHGHGAYAIFDYAAAGPYVPIDMHPDDPAERIDALFMSMHKFVGGPQSSGVLVANRALFRTRIPERPGGGTVDYVAGSRHDQIDYVSHLAEREEGGTPAIMSDIRAGAACLVKEMICAEEILTHETELASRVIQRLGNHPRIDILGPTDPDRLAIISFSVRDLHHDLVSALLDHLFGIQNRAGCSCAGPYGHRLLNIDEPTSARYRELTRRGLNAMKPGWVRLTVPYYASAEDLDYLLSAVEFVADHGLEFVPLYELGWGDGVWRHRLRPQPDIPPIELTLDAVREAAQNIGGGDHESPLSERQIAAERARYMDEARAMVTELRARWEQEPPRWNPATGDADVDELIWFRWVHADDLSAADRGTQAAQ